MINKVILVGHVGQDPKLITSKHGKPIARFSLATSKRWKQDGERMESTCWHNVVVFNETAAEYVKNSVGKGTRVYVEGELANRKWTGNDGIERFITEVVVANSQHRVEATDDMQSRFDGGGQGGGPRAPDPEGRESYGNPRRQSGTKRPADDEVPF